MKWASPKCRQRLSLLLLLTTARCVLPHDDQDLPATGFSNVNRDAILQVLIAPGDRRVGARLPLTVDVDVATKIAHPGQMMCVRLIGDPGTVLFPLGSDCPDDAAAMNTAGAAGGGGVASEKPAVAARACITVQAADSSQSASNGGASGTAGTAGKQAFKGRLTARAVAAYQPQASEAIATVFANLYSDSGCSELLQSTAVELKLTDTEVSSGGAGGSGPEGGAPSGGAGGTPAGGSPDGGGGGTGGASAGEGGVAPGGTNTGGAAGMPDTGGNPASAGQGGHS